MGWKGDAPMVRNITLGAAAGGMGMIGDEIVWKKAGAGKHPDVDGDGVGRELSVGDITAMTVYTAAQETPTELGRLAALGYVAGAGRRRCRTHRSRPKGIRDDRLRDAATRPRCRSSTRGSRSPRCVATAITTTPHWQRSTAATTRSGRSRSTSSQDAQAPRVEARTGGGAVVRLYRRSQAPRDGPRARRPGGPERVERRRTSKTVKYNGAPVMIPADHFLTAELWGVGNTGPWLHDNRAGTLREAILLHGEDAPLAGGRARAAARRRRHATRS